MNDSRNRDEYPPLQDTGSCGLHVVSGALDTGVVASKWLIEKILRAMYKFLHNSPTIRAEYIRFSVSGLFPEKFCTTWWVENEIVANRAIEFWSYIVKLIKLFLAKAPSRQPKDILSYKNSMEQHLNPLVIVYLHLFRDVAARLNVCLIKLQTDSPMVPFLAEEIDGILRWLMRFFVKKGVLKATDSTFKLSKIQVFYIKCLRVG